LRHHLVGAGLDRVDGLVGAIGEQIELKNRIVVADIKRRNALAIGSVIADFAANTSSAAAAPGVASASVV
jgi:hypothetical protein